MDYKKSLYGQLVYFKENIPNKKAIVMDGAEVTFSEFADDVDYIATLLYNSGVKVEDKVALMGNASIEWLSSYFSVMALGANVVVVNSLLPLNTVLDEVRYTDCNFVILDKFFLNRNKITEEEFAEKLEIDKKNIILLNDMFAKKGDKKYYDEINVPDEVKYANVDKGGNILFSSGTTDVPKAIYSKQSVLVNVTREGIQGFQYMVDKKWMICIPFFHIYGIAIFRSHLLSGNTSYMSINLDLNDIANIIEKEQIEVLVSIALIFDGICNNKTLIEKTRKSIEYCMIGGSNTTVSQYENYEKNFSNAKFICAYGTTETNGGISVTAPTDSKEKRYTTLGKPVKCADVKIWDKNKGYLKPNEIGEIVVKTSIIKTEYYKLPKSEQGIDENGYYHTGDIGLIDEGGYLIIKGRLKDIIIKGGENISAFEIENEILKDKNVHIVKVISMPDEKYGEVPLACIEVLDKSKFDEESMKESLIKALGRYKTPQKIVVLDNIPLNSSGKIDVEKIHEILRKS